MFDVLLELGFWTVRGDHVIFYLVDAARYLFAVPDLIIVYGHLRLILFESTMWHLITIINLVRCRSWYSQLPRGEDSVCLSCSLSYQEFLSVVFKISCFPI